MSYHVQNPSVFNFFGTIEEMSGQLMTAGEAIEIYCRAHRLSYSSFVKIVNSYAKSYGTRFTQSDLNGYVNRGISPKVPKMSAMCAATGMSIGYARHNEKPDNVRELVFAA